VLREAAVVKGGDVRNKFLALYSSQMLTNVLRELTEMEGRCREGTCEHPRFLSRRRDGPFRKWR